MRQAPRILMLITLVIGSGACGRSDLFSARRGGGGGIGVDPDGGIAGDGGGASSGRDGGLDGSPDAGPDAGGRGGTGGGVAGRGGTGGGVAGRGGAGGGLAGRGGVGGGVAGRGGIGGGIAGRGGAGGGVAGRGGVGGGVAGRGGVGGGIAGRGGRGGGNQCMAREICNNNDRDDDCNNLADCLDPGCFGDPRCAPPGQEVCNNNLDDDGDGRIDCADPDCMGSLACRPGSGPEVCDNGSDDNNDGLTDCADPMCTRFPGCLVSICSADVDFGAIAQHGARVTRDMDTRGSNATFATCAPAGGVARVGRFTLDAASDVRLDFAQTQGSAHVVGLYRAGANQACDRNPADCLNAMDSLTATRSYSALQPGVYWLIVQSYPSRPGATTVTLSTGAAATPEICNNGIDDDGNNFIDCADGACRGNPVCAGSECVPDRNIGTLVVNGPGQNVSVNLAAETDTYQTTCSAGQPGGDIAIALTLAEAAGLEVQFNQTGRSVFGLFRMPGPGLACDANQRSCAFEDQAANSVAFVGLSAGNYVFIVKAQPGNAGSINLRFSAFSGRRVEICGNNIDDDTNGLTDCADPACFGVAGCPAPACVPDQDIGAFATGTSRTVTVDTRAGGTLYATSCSRGTGRERVLRLTLTEMMSLGHDCTDTGSHVFELSRQVQPLDACNENDIVCVDPAVLPFGCGYSLPELQPGEYNLIVQAFQAGSEGVVTLTLTGLRSVMREICTNGIDDDGDGAIDCADRKCVTTPDCSRFSCRADQAVGLLPLDGSARSVVVQTAMAGDDQHATTCASAPGGQDGVVDFQVPATADVTMQWAQVGDHDFALYDDEGMLLACEVGTARGCVASDGMATGVHVFSALPPGRYHLVVDTDQPGREGGVVLQLTAAASVMP